MAWIRDTEVSDLAAELKEDSGLTSSAGTVDLLIDAARSCGFADISRPVGGVRPRSDDRVSHDHVTKLFQTMVDNVGSEALGVRLAYRAPLKIFNSAIYAFVASPTLGEGLVQWERFQALHSVASRMRVSHHGFMTKISVSLIDGVLPTTRAQIEWYMALILRYIDWQTDGEVKAAEVLLRGSMERVPQYEQLLDCPVRAGQPEDAIMLPRDTLAAASIHASVQVLEAVQKIAAVELGGLAASSVKLRVKAELRSRSMAEPIDINGIGRELGMSVRTLQRRLALEGTSFQQIVDQHFAEVAHRMLINDNRSIAQVAHACGFLDRRAFYRAFRRWTGHTPAHYRRDASLQRNS